MIIGKKGRIMIEGVKITPKQQIKDDRGMVAHMLRRDDDEYSIFGEIYFSYVKPKIVKGWHLHKEMTLNYIVVHGKIRLVLFDDRLKSKTRGEIMEIELDARNKYSLVTVPPQIWNGFIGLGNSTSIVANCATTPHDSLEIIRIDPFNNDLIKYEWHK
jgi:dTDP-4-dehydrorhamnose 3,5-epimerase